MTDFVHHCPLQKHFARHFHRCANHNRTVRLYEHRLPDGADAGRNSRHDGRGR